MTPVALLAMYVNFNGQDLHDYGRQATLVLDRTALDSTTWTSAGWTANTGGLRAGTLALESLDDFTDNLFDEIMWNAFMSTSGIVPFTIRPMQDPVGVSNPSYSGNVLVTGHSVGGAINTLAGKSLSFPLSGAVARAVA
ncbi:hypothetical protein [Catellatospora sp. NPDC049609]|uniref:hypothetical protein n=1 Tax=Catellatospora sp. NPDC049609 TaxID=3155505 RepID=UPI00342A646C